MESCAVVMRVAEKCSPSFPHTNRTFFLIRDVIRHHFENNLAALRTACLSHTQTKLQPLTSHLHPSLVLSHSHIPSTYTHTHISTRHTANMKFSVASLAVVALATQTATADWFGGNAGKYSTSHNGGKGEHPPIRRHYPSHAARLHIHMNWAHPD